MKINLRKPISILLAALMITLIACLLFACNKGDDAAANDAKLRAENVAVLKDKILGAMDENWAGELENARIAELENAGDYIVAAGWADMICDVLKNSALQTGKLTALKNAVLSEDGQKLLDDFAGNAELLIPLMRSANFTPTDISNLTYDLLCALVSDSGSLVDAMQARLSEVKSQAGIGVTASLNIEQCNLDLTKVKRDLIPSAQEKTQMLNAFAEAKAPISKLVEFAYNMSIGSITDNIFDALFSSDGALSDITDSEIGTVISTLINNVASLKDALDETALGSLNTAIGLIISKFDSNNSASTLYSQIVQYAKYVNMFVDVIPAMCDVLSSAANVFDSNLIAQLRTVAGESVNDNAQMVNKAIIAAKIALQAKEDFTVDELLGIIAGIGDKSTGEYQKTIPLFALDIALNISTWIQEGDSKLDIVGKHQDIMGSGEVDVMVGTVLFSFSWDNAKRAYEDYLRGKCAAGDVTSAITACSFEKFGVENPYSIFTGNDNLNDKWFNYYLTKGVEQVNEKALAVCESVLTDINKFISDFYASESPSRDLATEISDWQFVTELSNEEYKQYESKILQSDLIGIIGLISALF